MLSRAVTDLGTVAVGGGARVGVIPRVVSGAAVATASRGQARRHAGGGKVSFSTMKRGAARRLTTAAASDDNGFGLLEWLGPVIPQGILVTGVKGAPHTLNPKS